jgi:excisionase family DNA binding protein
MQSPETKPAFQGIQFPEFRERIQQEHKSNGHASPASGCLLTPQQVADRLGVSERWVRDHATRRSPRIPVVKLGALLRFRPADVEEFLRENTLPTPSKKLLSGV